MKKITTLQARDRKFYIVKNDQGYYLAIENKYIDENGKLNTNLNGLQMNASKDLNECLKRTKDQIEVDFLVSNGMDALKAIQLVVLGIA